MADYRNFCNTCDNEISFGNHTPWCGSMTSEEWLAKEMEKTFTELDFNVLTVEPLYECKRCFNIVRNRRSHFILHQDNNSWVGQIIN
jgi:predicted metal-binding protein